MGTIHPPFSSRLIMSNFCSIPTVFHRCFTWIALGDVHLCFSLMVTQANAVEGELHQPCVYHHQHNLSVHMTDGITVTSLSASLQYKARAATHHVCHIVLHQKLSNKFQKSCKF
jgi:hypothetical protein